MKIRILIDDEMAEVEKQEKAFEEVASEANDELDERAAAIRDAAIESWGRTRNKLCSFIIEEKLSPRPIQETIDLIRFCYCAGYSDALIERMKPNVGTERSE